MRDRADQRLAQQLSFRTHLGFVQRARDIETLKRRGGVGKHVVDPLADVGGAGLTHLAEIDRDHTEVGRFLRNAADQPGVAAAVADRGRKRRALLDVRDGGADALGQYSVVRLGIVSRAGSDQHHAALDEIGEMLLDRPVDVGR